jgi:PAS domain S-box-containing protein
MEANNSFCNMLGYSKEEILKLNVADWDKQWSPQELVNKIKAVIEQPEVFETRHYRKDGTHLEVEINGSGIMLEGRNYLYAVARDVTPQKKVMGEMANEIERLSAIIKGSNTATWEWNIQTGETIFNERWANIIGYTLDEISPLSIKTWEQFTHPGDLIKSRELLQKYFNGEAGFYECEARMKHKNGDWVWVLDRGQVSKWDINGKPVLMSGTHKDITVYKRMAIQLQESEAKVRRSHEIAKICTWEFDLATGKMIESDQLLNVFGITVEQFDGTFDTIAERFVHPADRELFNQSVETALQTGFLKPFEYRVIRPDKKTIWLKAVGEIIFENGKMVRMIGLNHDITYLKEAEIKQQEAHDRLLKIAGQLPGVVYQFRLHPDGAASMPFASEGMFEIFGVSPEEAMEDSTRLFKNVHPDDHLQINSSILESAKNLTPWEQVYRLHLADGTLRVLFAKSIPQLEDDGSVLWHGFISDITQRKKEEMIQQEAKDLVANIASQVPGIIFQFRLGADGIMSFPFVSDAAKEIVGVTPEEIRADASCAFNLLHPDDYANILESITASAQNFAPWQQEYRVILRDGSVHTQYGNAVPQMEADGSILWHGFITDITERKKAESLQQEIQDRLNKIAKMVPGVIYQYRLSPDGTASFPYISDLFKKFYRQSAGKVKDDASQLFENIHPEDYPAFVDSVTVSATNLSPWQHEFRLMDEDGKQLTVFGSSIPQQEADGSIIWSGIITDITELSKAKERIQQLSTAVEQSPASIMITDTDGTIEYVNKKFVEVTGYSPEEVIGNNPRILKSGNKSKEEYSRLWECILTNGEWKGEFYNKKKDGSFYWESATISSITNAAGKITHFLSIQQDITESRLLNEKIMELNRDFVSFLDNTSDFIYFTDINRRFRFCSKPMAEISGHANWRDMIGKNDQEIFPADMAQIYDEEDLTIISEGIPLLNKEDPYYDAAGNKRWVNTNKWPLFDEEGKVTGLFGISHDITDRKLAEQTLQKYAAELKGSNDDLENFAYIASHDLQEPLRMVTGFLKLLEKKLEGQLNATTQQYLHFATDGANRMKILINDLLQYSRVGNNKDAFTETNLDEMLDYIIRVLKETIDKDGAVITVKPLPVIKANKILLNELFLNLLNNALKYQGDQPPAIEVGCHETADQYTFYVKDNGIGISAEYFSRIFVIFQRLHARDEYSGTGIGLALCKKIVETHHGKIWVESEEGTGSTFYFSIPK